MVVVVVCAAAKGAATANAMVRRLGRGGALRRAGVWVEGAPGHRARYVLAVGRNDEPARPGEGWHGRGSRRERVRERAGRDDTS